MVKTLVFKMYHLPIKVRSTKQMINIANVIIMANERMIKDSEVLPSDLWFFYHFWCPYRQVVNNAKLQYQFSI